MFINLKSREIGSMPILEKKRAEQKTPTRFMKSEISDMKLISIQKHEMEAW